MTGIDGQQWDHVDRAGNGANRGLGFETARELAGLGHDVWLCARNEQAANEAADLIGARPVVLDVTDDDSVRAAAAAVTPGGLDILVNNAGIAGTGKPPELLTADDLAALYDVNVFGAVRMLHAFLPVLRKSDNGVVVNVGSGLGSFARVLDPDRIESGPAVPAYTSSKAALSMLTLQYAGAFPELRINVVDPGFTATALNDHRGTQTVAEGAAPIVAAALLGPDGPTGTFIDGAGTAPW